MIFKGYGSVWNPKKGSILVDFNTTEPMGEYISRDEYEIEILKNCPNVYDIKDEVMTEEELNYIEVKEESIEETENEETIEADNAIILPETNNMTKEEIRAELDILGISFDNRWGIDRLKKVLAENK
jgi:hypothetical protein